MELSALSLMQSNGYRNEQGKQIKIIALCTKKIEAVGEKLGLSFYAFWANKNENPAALMEVAK